MLLNYLKQGTEYALAALMAAGAAVCVAQLVSKGKLTRTQRIKILLTAGYFLTLCFTVFGARAQYGAAEVYRFKYSLYLFENLRSAVREKSADAVIQLALNVIMFIPCGAVLLWTGRKDRRGRVFIRIPLIALVIESVQFLTGWGLFDIDDLVCNTLGGYFGAFVFLAAAEKSRRSLIPAALLAAMAAGACAVYCTMPFGLLPEDVINCDHTRPGVVLTEAESLAPQTLSVYRAVERGRNDAAPQIEAIFGAIGDTVDYGTRDEYETCVIYRGSVPAHYLWYNFDGSFRLELGQREVPLPEGTSAAEQVLALLDNMGYDLPGSCETGTPGTIIFRMEEYGGSVFDGSIEFVYSGDKLCSLKYSVSEMEYCGEADAYTEREVQKNLLRGRFSADREFDGAIGVIEISACTIEYRMDTKGFCRPVYVLSAMIDGEPGRLTASAVSYFQALKK